MAPSAAAVGTVAGDTAGVPDALNRSAIGGIAVTASIALTACGLNVSSPDLFLLQRTGQGKSLTILIRDDGTVHCNGRRTKPLSDPQLLQARDLASSLDKDAKAKLHLSPTAGSIYSYVIKLQNGTISFADKAAAAHHELAQAELLALEVAQNRCTAT